MKKRRLERGPKLSNAIAQPQTMITSGVRQLLAPEGERTSVTAMCFLDRSGRPGRSIECYGKLMHPHGNSKGTERHLLQGSSANSSRTISGSVRAILTEPARGRPAILLIATRLRPRPSICPGMTGSRGSNYRFALGLFGGALRDLGEFCRDFRRRRSRAPARRVRCRRPRRAAGNSMHAESVRLLHFADPGRRTQ